MPAQRGYDAVTKRREEEPGGGLTGGSSTITNVYDIVGRVLTTSEGGTSLTYTYDDLGRNTSFTDKAGLVSTYTYDLDGHRLTSTYPTSVEVKRFYDASNRLQYLKDGSDTTMATYSYDILDRVTGVSLANGTSVSYGYDLLNRVGSVDNTLGSGNRDYSYVYDNGSRVTQIIEPRGTIASDYTKRNEVKGIVEPSGSPFADQTFAYDAGFNRASWTLGTTSTSYTANNLDQYSAVGSATPAWNSNGGLYTFGGNTYIYDALMRLTEVDYSGGKTLFTYDPLGRRVKKVDENSEGTPIATFSYHYDQSEVAVEYQPSTTWTYYLGLGLDQVVLRDSGSAKQWYYRDGHGSTSAVADNSGNVLEAYEYDAQGDFQITNASGTVVEQYKYDAFGKPSFFDGSGNPLTASAYGNRFLFTGREYLAKVNLYDYRNRVYSADLGRFLQTDPMSFSAGDVNIYRYCGNNPLNGTDAMGLCPNYTISLGFTSDGGGGAYDSNGNPIPNPNAEHAPTSLDPSGPTLPDGNEPGAVPPGYGGAQTGAAGLDTDGGTPAAVEGSDHSSQTSLPGENADSDPYAAQNPNPDGSYTYPPGTPTYTVNNDTGVGAEGVLGDNATPNNNNTGTLETSTALGNTLGTTQYSNGQLQNSTNGASLTTYYYP